MINDKNQKQEGGENSVNLQAQIININQGLSTHEVRELVKELFKENFIIMKSEAAEIAKSRAEEITELFLNKASEKGPELLNEFRSPGMQDTFFTAQKEYAKSGDKNLGDVLVDILVDRASKSERTILQIVLDESVKIATKLTPAHYDILTLCFLLTRVVRLDMNNLESLKSYLDNTLCVFADNLDCNRSSYTYLEFLNCGHVRAGSWGDFTKKMRTNYQGLFQIGLTKEEFDLQLDNKFSEVERFLCPCLHDEQKLQVGYGDMETLKAETEKAKLDMALAKKLEIIFQNQTMTDQVVVDYLKGINPKIEKIAKEWRETTMKNFELTDMGLVIGHANLRRKVNEFYDINIWVK